jgi:hypothetical protein
MAQNSLGAGKGGFQNAPGVARAKTQNSWILLGILPLSDPSKIDSKETIARANGYGVSVKMVTGVLCRSEVRKSRQSDSREKSSRNLLAANYGDVA